MSPSDDDPQAVQACLDWYANKKRPHALTTADKALVYICFYGALFLLTILLGSIIKWGIENQRLVLMTIYCVGSIILYMLLLSLFMLKKDD